MNVSAAPGREPASKLTNREREIVTAIGQGVSTAAVARRLNISVRTVESHVWNAYDKLAVHNRVELMRWLLRHGLIDPDL